jgi:vacuolar-type H+-ATPase subunit E/Vma4
LSEGIKLIKEGIRQKALTQVQQILSNAEKEAKTVIEKAKSEVKEEAGRRAKVEKVIIRRKIVGSAELEGRKAILKARDEVMSKVFKAVEAKLRDLARKRSSDYEKVLFNLIKEGVTKIGERRLIIAANERDMEYLKGELKAFQRRLSKELGYDVRLEVANDPYDCMGGVVVFNADKTKVFYNTLEGRLLKLWDALKLEVNKILFTRENV